MYVNFQSICYQIFGLCGVNGAGKTSTFRMLTGQLVPSTGFASLGGHEIGKRRSRRLIGYCPQMDAVDLLLTGRQVLEFYCQLKGIHQPDNVSTVIQFVQTASSQQRC